MTNRQRLPNRRTHETITFEHAGLSFSLGVGRHDDGAVGELFLTPDRSGGALESIARDAAIILSLALQHGVEIDTIKHALTQDHNGAPASLIGAALAAVRSNVRKLHLT
jgi:hypothetical protein